MTKTIFATFDGEVLRPEEAVALEPNTRVRVTIEAAETEHHERSFLRTAEALNLQGPADWSTSIDKYLYGEPQPRA